MKNDIPAGIDPFKLMLSSERDIEVKNIISELSRMDAADRIAFITKRIIDIRKNGSNNDDIQILREAVKRGGFLRSLTSAADIDRKNRLR